jgi:hypothetical protein
VRALLSSGLDVADAEQDEEHPHIDEVAPALSVAGNCSVRPSPPQEGTTRHIRKHGEDLSVTTQVTGKRQLRRATNDRQNENERLTVHEGSVNLEPG